MSTAPLPKEEIARTRRAWELSGGNTTKAAAILNIPRSTMQNRVQRLELKPPVRRFEAPEALDVRAAQRQADEMRDLRKSVKQLTRELNEADDLRAAVFQLKQQDTTPPKWLVTAGTKKADVQVPILFASDFHVGEYIKAEELDGINAFDQHIARERYRKLIEKTIVLTRDYMGTTTPTYPGIIYIRGGDMVAGDIHDLKETNDLKAIPAVKLLVSLERWGLAELQKAFGHVWVINLPGNHGRDSDKPHSKEHAARNFDTLSGYMLELAFEDQDGFQFWSPESGDAVFNVLGHTFLATHGDKIGTGGGRGFVGAAAPIARGAKLLSDYYAALGITIDYRLIGHFHSRMEVANTFANGCLCGYSQYGKQFRFAPVAPEQWLLVVNAKYGVTARWAIQLSERPRVKGAPAFEQIN